MSQNQLIPHLFRTEYSKIVAVLCSVFGLNEIELAEDMVSETFLIATETWGLKGVPDNPTAWLYTVAKNKTKDYFKHHKIFNEKVKPALQNESLNVVFELDLSDKNITDSQLRMLFAICNPILKKETQIALALRILCGFGIDEIAQAFLTNKATINKRLQRGKAKLRLEKVDLLSSINNSIDDRLDTVLSVIYLLFNEGYYSVTSKKTIQKELCIEAMRLTYMLLNYSRTNLPKTNALMALLCFHSSRFDARTSDTGELILYANQNRDKWNYELIKKGAYFLNLSVDHTYSKYHYEAIISYWHTKEDDTANKWESILQSYNQLLQISYSPAIALNRTYALSRANSKKEAILEALKINLKEYHLYHMLLANLYETENKKKQLFHLKEAFLLAKTTNDRKLIQQKIDAIK